MSGKHIIDNLHSYAQAVIETYQIPAVSLAVWKDGALNQSAAGILNLNTGVTATTESIFQIGSITKVMTASLVMQLVDEGKVELDNPVKHYLRDFQVAHEEATHCITVRQLLNHTSGMAGDYFPDDLDDQGNLIARYIDRCSCLPLVHPVGAMFSYSNSAYAVAGRLVEVVRGVSWYQAMREAIFRPLGMEHAVADPKDMIRHRTAIGHIKGQNGEWVVPEQPYLTLGLAPVGSTPMISAADLITFARAHLEEGVSQRGERWLSPSAVAAMQRPQVEKPRDSLHANRFMGLGWSVSKLPGGTNVIGHGGGTRGCLSNLLLIPAQNIAVALVINGMQPEVVQALTQTLLAEVAGIDIGEPDPEPVSLTNKELKAFAGAYESLDRLIEVRLDGQALQAHVVFKVDPLPPADVRLTPLGKDIFAVYAVEGQRGKNLCFLRDRETGVPGYMYMGGRLNRRVDAFPV